MWAADEKLIINKLRAKLARRINHITFARQQSRSSYYHGNAIKTLSLTLNLTLVWLDPNPNLTNPNLTLIEPMNLIPKPEVFLSIS